MTWPHATRSGTRCPECGRGGHPLDLDLTRHRRRSWPDCCRRTSTTGPRPCRASGSAHPIHLVGSSATVDTGTGEVLSGLLLGGRGDGRDLDPVRQPPSQRVPVLLPGLRRRHVPPDPGRGHRRQERPGDGGGEPAGVRHPDRPVVRARPRKPPTAVGAGPAAHGEAVRARPADGLHAAHEEEDPRVGQPLCWECYDYASHVVWQWWAPELWRRFTIALRRSSRIGSASRKAARPIRDAAVRQGRRVPAARAIHFHALVRLDGPKTPRLRCCAGLAHRAASRRSRRRGSCSRAVHRPTGLRRRRGRVLAFGAQVDARPVRTGDAPTTPSRP